MTTRTRQPRRRFADGADADLSALQREVTEAVRPLVDDLPPDVQEQVIYVALGVIDSGETDDVVEAIEAALLIVESEGDGEGGDQFAAPWNEDDHPRDGGKFAPKDGASGGGGAATAEDSGEDHGSADASASDSGLDSPGELTAPGELGAPESKVDGKGKSLRERASGALKGIAEKARAARAAVKEKGLIGAGKAAATGAYNTAKATASGIAKDLEGAGYSPRVAKGIAGLAAAIIVSPVGFSALAGGALGMPALAMVPGVVEAGAIVKGAKGVARMHARGKKAAAAALARVRGKKKPEAEAARSRDRRRKFRGRVVHFGAPQPAIDPARVQGIQWKVKYGAYRQPNGRYTVLDVPIFAMVVDDSRPGFVADREWMERAAELYMTRAREVGHYRAGHLDHQELMSERSAPKICFLDNVRVQETTWGPLHYCDLAEIEEKWVRKMEAGDLPFLSIEAIDDEIVGLAFMESRPPHWPFPNFVVEVMDDDLSSVPSDTSASGGRQLAASAAGDRMQMFSLRASRKRRQAKAPNRRTYAMPQDDDRETFSNPMDDDAEDFADDMDGEDFADDAEEDDFAADGGAPAEGEPMPAWAPQLVQMMVEAMTAAASGGGAAQDAPPDTTRPIEPATAYSKGKGKRVSTKRRKFRADQIDMGGGKTLADIMQAQQQQEAKSRRERAFAALTRRAREHGANDAQLSTLSQFSSVKDAEVFVDHIVASNANAPENATVTIVEMDTDEQTRILDAGLQSFRENAGMNAHDRAQAEKFGRDALQQYRDSAKRLGRKFTVHNPSPERWVRRRTEEALLAAKN